MEGTVCTGAPVPHRKLPEGWRGRAARSLETWTLLRRGPRGAKARARAAGPKSRAFETDARRLTDGFTAHGGSSENSSGEKHGLQTKTPQTHLSPWGDR
jgi:hypothetical protein